MEGYIDDMLVKSLKTSDHIAHLGETFSILRKHRMYYTLPSVSLEYRQESFSIS